MGLTSITDRLTPSSPIELTFGAQPSAGGRKFATLFCHKKATGATATDWQVYTVLNCADALAVKAELDPLGGTDGEATKMAQAFINAVAKTGGSNFGLFRICFMPNAETGFGSGSEAQAAIQALRSDLLVNPYDFLTSAAAQTALKGIAITLSGADRDGLGQFGTTAVSATLASKTTVTAMTVVDSQYSLLVGMPDTDGSVSQSVGEVAAAMAALMLGSAFPYLPLDSAEVGGLLPPTLLSDRVILGPSSDSELFLQKGVVPLYVDAAGKVRVVRSVLSQTTTNGTIPKTAYLDWQDVQTLYDFREDCYIAVNSPNLRPGKASKQAAGLIKDEVLRIADRYEENLAFQNVAQSAKLFQVAISATSRGRIDFKIPVDVIPGLHVVAGNIQGTVFTL